MITAVDGKDVDAPAELARMIGGIAPGKDVDVTLWRDGKAETVKLDARRAAGDRQAGRGSTSSRRRTSATRWRTSA